MTMQVTFCGVCEGKGTLSDTGLCAWCFDEHNNEINANDKCDRGDCLMCNPEGN